ncbi:MAG: signal peptidase II [Bacteroidota bacterium]
MRVLWISVFVVIIDQITKLLVLQKMYVGQSIALVGDWLKFTFTENPGMAFGITFGVKGLVPILSVSATLLILFYLYKVRHTYSWYRISIGFILGGAFGNIIDRVFYGAIFYNNRLFTGHVVDFIHVNLWRGYIPESWPFVGGKYAALFPIWNVADMAIVLGVIGILVFQNKFQESLIEAVPEHQDADVVGAVAADAARSEMKEDAAVFPPETAGGNGVEEDTVKKDL